MGDQDYPKVAGIGCATGMLWSFFSGRADPTTKKGWAKAALSCVGSAVNSTGIFFASDKLMGRDTAWKATGAWWGVQGLAGLGNWMGRKKGWEREPLYNAVQVPLNYLSSPAFSTIGLLYGLTSFGFIRDPRGSVDTYGGMLGFRTKKKIHPLPGFSSYGFALGAIGLGLNNKTRTHHELGHTRQFSLLGDLGAMFIVGGENLIWLLKGADKDSRPKLFSEKWADHMGERTFHRFIGSAVPWREAWGKKISPFLAFKTKALKGFSAKEQAIIKQAIIVDLARLKKVIGSLKVSADKHEFDGEADSEFFAHDMEKLEKVLREFSDNRKLTNKLLGVIKTFFGKTGSTANQLDEFFGNVERISERMNLSKSSTIDPENKPKFTDRMKKVSREIRQEIMVLLLTLSSDTMKDKVNNLIGWAQDTIRHPIKHPRDKGELQKYFDEMLGMVKYSDEARRLILKGLKNSETATTIPTHVVEPWMIALGAKGFVERRKRRQGWSIGTAGHVNYHLGDNGSGRGARLWMGRRNRSNLLEVRFNALFEQQKLQDGTQATELGVSVEPIFHLVRDPGKFDPYLSYEVGAKYSMDAGSTNFFGAVGPGLQVDLGTMSLHGSIKVGAERSSTGFDALLQGSVGLSYKF